MSTVERVVLFLGPTLPVEEALRCFPDAEVRGPVARGDVLRATLDGARALGIIDGFFEHALSVQHKEVLWALQQGVAVYGAASMGALRAAELNRYGMVGVGEVYRQFVDGVVEDDDEVAIVHGPSPGYRRLSDALVNIRATLHAALERGLVSECIAEELESIAKCTFYPERSYEQLLGFFLRNGGPPAVVTSLREWLADPCHRIDQKKLDAERLLARMAADAARGFSRTIDIDWDFPWTAAWNLLWEEIAGERAGLDAAFGSFR